MYLNCKYVSLLCSEVLMKKTEAKLLSFEHFNFRVRMVTCFLLHHYQHILSYLYTIFKIKPCRDIFHVLLLLY